MCFVGADQIGPVYLVMMLVSVLVLCLVLILMSALVLCLVMMLVSYSVVDGSHWLTLCCCVLLIDIVSLCPNGRHCTIVSGNSSVSKVCKCGGHAARVKTQILSL